MTWVKIDIPASCVDFWPGLASVRLALRLSNAVEMADIASGLEISVEGLRETPFHSLHVTLSLWPPRSFARKLDIRRPV